MKYFALFVLVLVILGGGLGALLFLQREVVIVIPRFTDYATTTEALLQKASQPLVLVPLFNIESTLGSTTYPSELLETEVDYLVGLISKREKEQESSFAILYGDAWQISMVDSVLQKVVVDSGRIHTKEIIDIVWADIEVLVAREQLRYNVARPMQIDLRVNTALKTPPTPSYPNELAAKLVALREVMSAIGYSDQTLEDAINISIEQTHVYGINTRLDTIYATDLAKTYLKTAFETNPVFKEYLQIAKEREWSDNELVPFENGFTTDISIEEMYAENVPGGVLFSVNVKDFGLVSTPTTYPIKLEVDVYGDGEIDYQEVFNAKQLHSEQEDTPNYFMPITKKGEHLFRFTLDPDGRLREQSYINNIGAWSTVTIQ